MSLVGDVGVGPGWKWLPKSAIEANLRQMFFFSVSGGFWTTFGGAEISKGRKPHGMCRMEGVGRSVEVSSWVVTHQRSLSACLSLEERSIKADA